MPPVLAWLRRGQCIAVWRAMQGASQLLLPVGSWGSLLTGTLGPCCLGQDTDWISLSRHERSALTQDFLLLGRYTS